MAMSCYERRLYVIFDPRTHTRRVRVNMNMDEHTIRNLLLTYYNAGADATYFLAGDGFVGVPNRDEIGVGGVNGTLPLLVSPQLTVQLQQEQQRHLQQQQRQQQPQQQQAPLPLSASRVQTALPTLNIMPYGHPSIFGLRSANVHSYGGAGVSPAPANFQQISPLRTVIPVWQGHQGQIGRPSSMSDNHRILLDGLQGTSVTRSYLDGLGLSPGGSSLFNDPYSAVAQPIFGPSRVIVASAPPAEASSAAAVASPLPAKASTDRRDEDLETAQEKKRGRDRRNGDKPKRPLSAYNIFFKEERLRLLDSIDKTHGKGKISFESLGKIVGGRWRDLDSDKVGYYKAKADDDLRRYRKETEEYNKKQLCNEKDGDLEHKQAPKKVKR